MSPEDATKWFLRLSVAIHLGWTLGMLLVYGPEPTISRTLWRWSQDYDGFAAGMTILVAWLLWHFFGNPIKWS